MTDRLDEIRAVFSPSLPTSEPRNVQPAPRNREEDEAWRRAAGSVLAGGNTGHIATIRRMLLRLIRTLPKARRWAIDVVNEHASRSASVATMGFERLREFVGAPFLERARVAVVERAPRPPLEQWGFHGADDFVGFEASGITLLRTMFLKRDHADNESTVFHELVHVLQWETLGVNRFLAMYGLQLLEHGYSGSPLETMAYDLQRRFVERQRPFNMEPIVVRRTWESWANLARQSVVHRAACAALAIAPGRLKD